MKTGDILTSGDIYLGDTYLGKIEELKITSTVDPKFEPSIACDFFTQMNECQTITFTGSCEGNIFKAIYPKKDRQVWNRFIHARSKRQRMKQFNLYYGKRDLNIYYTNFVKENCDD
jgi:hypothetical protein